MSLKGKIVFITGASAGIGAATALAFAAEGARLLLAARRAGKLAEVASQALERGAPAVHSVDLDVRDRRAVQQAIDDLPAEWAEIDILVNNAGLSRGLDKLYMGKIHDWEEMIDTNVKGLLYVTRAVVPGMVVRGRGHVINLGSTAGETHLSQRRSLLRDQGCRALDQRRAAPGCAGNAGARYQRRSGDGRDRFQPGALPRRQRARGQGLQGSEAADAGGCRRCDCVGGEPARACQHRARVCSRRCSRRTRSCFIARS